MSQSITILVVDDHGLIRDMLKRYLDEEADMRVVGCESNARDAVRLCIAAQPDVVLLDIDMPGLSAFEGGRLIKIQCPATRLIFLRSCGKTQLPKRPLKRPLVIMLALYKFFAA